MIRWMGPMSTRVWVLSRAVLSTSIWDGPLPEPVYVCLESSIWFRYSWTVAALGHAPSQDVHANHHWLPLAELFGSHCVRWSVGSFCRSQMAQSPTYLTTLEDSAPSFP